LKVRSSEEVGEPTGAGVQLPEVFQLPPEELFHERAVASAIDECAHNAAAAAISAARARVRLPDRLVSPSKVFAPRRGVYPKNLQASMALSSVPAACARGDDVRPTSHWHSTDAKAQ